MKNIVLFIIAVLAFSSCRKDTPAPAPKTPAPIIEQNGGVFITNEGNYQWSNSSVTYYKFSDVSVTEDIFKPANNRPLGDICQSIEIHNGKAYLVVNNSGKIEVVNPSDFKSVAVISGFTSPRFFLGVSTTKAYVTDLYSNSISVVDLNSNSILKQITCSGWTEEMVISANKVFVTNLRKEYIYVIDPVSDLSTDSIKVGFAPNSVKVDKNGKVWVLCSGNSSRLPSLHKINPNTTKVEVSLEFNSQSDTPTKLKINGNKDQLYFLNSGVFKLNITDNSLPGTPVISQNNMLFYGLGIDPANDNIYVSDAIDYVQKGKIYRYDKSGSLISNFTAGIIPGEFYFYK